MDQQQYEIACEIVSLDCTIMGLPKDGRGGFCAIGGLYAAIDPDWAVNPDLEYDKYLVYGAVKEAFGLNFNPIWMANDGALVFDEPIERRRDRVKAALLAQLDEGATIE